MAQGLPRCSRRKSAMADKEKGSEQKPPADKSSADKSPADKSSAKKTSAAKPPAAKNKRRKRRKGSKAAQRRGELTTLAKGLIIASLVWVVAAGGFAFFELYDRRSNCLNWMEKQPRGDQGWLRVYNQSSKRYGCSLAKLPFSGYVASPPMFPGPVGFAGIFIPPIGIMSIYMLMLAFRRHLVLKEKKREWAKAEPIDLTPDENGDIAEEDW